MAAMIRLLRIVSAAAALSLSVTPLASAQTPETFHISAKVQKDGRLIGAPTMRVRAGETASISVEGDDGYVLTAKAEPVEGATDQAKVTAELTLAGEAQTRTANMVVRLGEPAALTFGSDKHPVAVEVTVAR